MAKVFLICGSTGAGKSTTASLLSKQHRAHIFSIDEWMKHLFWKDSPQSEVFTWAIERVRRCEDLMWVQAERLLANDVNVVLDLGFSFRSQRQKFYDALEKNGSAFELLFLDVEPDVRRKRVHKRNSEMSETFQFQVSDEMFDWMETQFQPPNDEELLQYNGLRVTQI